MFSLLSPTDKAFCRGYEALAEEFNSHGYALDNILKHLKFICKLNKEQSGQGSQKSELINHSIRSCTNTAMEYWAYEVKIKNAHTRSNDAHHVNP